MKCKHLNNLELFVASPWLTMILQVVKIPDSAKILFLMRVANIAGPMPQKDRKILQVLLWLFITYDSIELYNVGCSYFFIFDRKMQY